MSISNLEAKRSRRLGHEDLVSNLASEFWTRVEELTRADGKELRFCPNCRRSILDADGTCQRCRWRRIAKDLALALRKAEKLSSPTTIGEEDCMTRADETRGESAPLSSGSTASTHPLKMAQEATYQEGSVK